MRRILIVIIFFSTTALLTGNDSKGPLVGKNYYVPFIPYYSFPGYAAAPGSKRNLSISISNYFIQDMVTEFHQIGTTLEQERFIDYEGYVLEPTVSYNFLDNLEVGLTGRIHFYYGGFWDPVIEGFHSIFGFPNGGRNLYPANDVFINIQTTSGIDLSLTEPLAAIGDTDLFVKWSFLSLNFMDAAFFSAFKIPTGSMENISGSGYPDLGFSLLMDFYPLKWLTIYLQNGIVIPGQLFVKTLSAPEPIYTLVSAFEFILSPKISLIAQFRLNTSPIKEGTTVPLNISYTVKLHQPMTNILAGVVFYLSDYRCQVYFEEDAFTNNGADLILNLAVSKSFHL